MHKDPSLAKSYTITVASLGPRHNLKPYQWQSNRHFAIFTGIQPHEATNWRHHLSLCNGPHGLCKFVAYDTCEPEPERYTIFRVDANTNIMR